MSKIDAFCKKCNNFIISNDLLAVFQQGQDTNCHLIVKVEKKNPALVNLNVVDQPEKKKAKFAPLILLCKKCDSKLGSDTLIGPKDEATYALSADKIFFIEKPGGKRHDFDSKWKWKDHKSTFAPRIEFRTFATFFGVGSNANGPTRSHLNLATKLPTARELSDFNIGDHVDDIPRTYQIELYNAAVFNNTVVYLPTGAGKTMVAAMLAACMKKFNPKKKVFFVCDRLPLVFQQASYLRCQTGLSVGEFCSESRQQVASQQDADIKVFTCAYLINKLNTKEVFMEDCCCLIIDEVHHARAEHPFQKLLDDFFYTIQNKELRPRILGRKIF
jgi:hypothetical protein